MVVKDKIGRRRYILFNAQGFKKSYLLKKIREYEGNLKLVFYNESYGIVKCKHTEKEKVIEFLRNAGIETKVTSGTIKKLKRIISSSSQASAN